MNGDFHFHIGTRRHTEMAAVTNLDRCILVNRHPLFSIKIKALRRTLNSSILIRNLTFKFHHKIQLE